jgi:hypothetical protein
MRKTKILCTLGSVSKDSEIIRQMIAAGTDVPPPNKSHAKARVGARHRPLRPAPSSPASDPNQCPLKTRDDIAVYTRPLAVAEK